MKEVDQHHKFKFKEACPYCGGDLECQADSWEQQDDGTWKADHLDIECLTMPDMDKEDEWEAWWLGHNMMPYENWLPMTLRVEKYIGENYRFKMQNK